MDGGSMTLMIFGGFIAAIFLSVMGSSVLSACSLRCDDRDRHFHGAGARILDDEGGPDPEADADGEDGWAALQQEAEL